MITEDDLVKVQILCPILKKYYGSTASYGREKAYRGQTAGKWKVINDPNEPKQVIETRPKINLDKGKIIYNELVSIIIIALNNLDYTSSCIDSIRKHTKEDHQIILVDNGSTDQTSIWFIKNMKENDVLIRNPVNAGFSKANNQALKLAKGEYVLFLNNDTRVEKDGWLWPFLEGIKDADIVGPTMRKLVADHHDFSFLFAGDGHDLDSFCYLEGWCLFARKIVFDALGGMDEQFSPAYSEDADLSFKAVQAGFRIKKIENVPIVHYGSKTSTKMSNEIFGITIRNRRKLYAKWVSKKNANILIRRHGAIGDVLMITPVLRALKKAYPKSRLYVETKCPQLIENNPNIEEILNSADQDNFDQVYTLEYENFPGEIRIDSMMRQAGIQPDGRKMDIFLNEPKSLPMKKPYAVFHTGKSWPNRELLIDKWAIVAEWLLSNGYRIAEVGNSQTKHIPAQGIKDFKNNPWPLVSKLIRNAEFFIGIDSACSNLAKAVGTPAFIFYGCVNPAVMLADAIEYPIVARNLDCIGCRDRSSAHYVECPKIEPFCCTTIDPQTDILSLIENFIESRKAVAA